MSNYKRLEAAIPGHSAAQFPKPFELLQDRYRVKAYKNRPLTQKFLTIFAEELKTWFENVEIEEGFKTSDGSVWTRISFKHKGYPFTYQVLFPECNDAQHEHGTVSNQHVALYVQGDVLPTADHLRNIARAFVHLIEADLYAYYI